MTYEKAAEKVTKLLVKRGFGEEAAKNMVDNELESAMRAYPDSKPSYWAEVVVM